MDDGHPVTNDCIYEFLGNKKCMPLLKRSIVRVALVVRQGSNLKIKNKKKLSGRTSKASSQDLRLKFGVQILVALMLHGSS